MSACIRHDRTHERAGNPSTKLIEQRLRLFKIRRVEAFGEPPVNGSEKVASLRNLAFVAQEVREPRPGTKLKSFRPRDRANLKPAGKARHNVDTITTIEPPKRFS